MPARMTVHTAFAFFMAVVASPARAADAIVPGALSAPHPTLENLSILWPFTGDDDGDSVVTVRYRKQGDAAWREGLPLRRAAGRSHYGHTWTSRHAGSLFDLEPGRAYEVEATLTDPDGGSETRTLTADTRPVPAPMPGAPVKAVTPATFASVAAGAQPGDVLDLGPGTYSGFTFSRNGSPGMPIVIRSAGGAVVQGTVNLDGRRWVYLDGLTVDGRIRMHGSSWMAVMRSTVTIPPGAPEGDERSGIVFYNGRSENNTIADNVVTGIAPWEVAQMGCCAAPFWGEGIQFTGPGHVVMNNRVHGFRDNISTMETSEAIDQWSIDIVNNDLSLAVDDAVEADYCFHNCRVMRNRVTNAFIGMSSQPGLGGPTYFVRNAMYNLILTCFKLNNGSIGDVIVHNTVVKSGDAFAVTTGEAFSRTYARNNLFIGGAGWSGGGWSSGSGDVVYMPAASAPDLDYDAFGAELAPFVFKGQIGGTRFNGLAELRSRTTYVHAVQAGLSAFASAVAHPANPLPERPAPDLRPAMGSAVADAAVPLPGLNDAFNGAGPDIGAYEAGAPLPGYGPRPGGLPAADRQPPARPRRLRRR